MLNLPKYEYLSTGQVIMTYLIMHLMHSTIQTMHLWFVVYCLHSTKVFLDVSSLNPYTNLIRLAKVLKLFNFCIALFVITCRLCVPKIIRSGQSISKIQSKNVSWPRFLAQAVQLHYCWSRANFMQIRNVNEHCEFMRNRQNHPV